MTAPEETRCERPRKNGAPCRKGRLSWAGCEGEDPRSCYIHFTEVERERYKANQADQYTVMGRLRAFGMLR